MSGGRFDYLYTKDIVEMIEEETRWHLDAMRAELVERGLSDVVDEHDAYIEILDGIQRKMHVGEQMLGRLSRVWKAVELHVSGDSGIESVDEAVREYRGSVPPSPEILSVRVSIDRDEPYEVPLLTLVPPRGHDPTVFPVRDEVTVSVAAPGEDSVLTIDLGRADRPAFGRQQKPVRASDRRRLFLSVPVPRGAEESSEHPVPCFFGHIGFWPARWSGKRDVSDKNENMRDSGTMTLPKYICVSEGLGRLPDRSLCGRELDNGVERFKSMGDALRAAEGAFSLVPCPECVKHRASSKK